MLTILLTLTLAQLATLDHADRSYPLYPATTPVCPDLPSPLAVGGREYVVIELADGTFGLADVTLADHPEQVTADDEFPQLAATGLHDPAALTQLTEINGWPLDRIDRDARPGGLSEDGFIAFDETGGVMAGTIVRAHGPHPPDLARPLGASIAGRTSAEYNGHWIPDARHQGWPAVSVRRWAGGRVLDGVLAARARGWTRNCSTGSTVATDPRRNESSAG